MRQVLLQQAGLDTIGERQHDPTQVTSSSQYFSLEATASGFLGLLHNGPFISALVAFAFAQLAKVFTNFYELGIWDWKRLVGSGGMPSSHTAFVLGMTTAVGLKEGTYSSFFAMCLIFSLVVMYDATGVRLHAGRQASVLNILMAEMPSDHPVQASGVLRDSLGHTPIEVFVGLLVGVVIGYLVELSFLSATKAA